MTIEHKVEYVEGFGSVDVWRIGRDIFASSHAGVSYELHNEPSDWLSKEDADQIILDHNRQFRCSCHWCLAVRKHRELEAMSKLRTALAAAKGTGKGEPIHGHCQGAPRYVLLRAHRRRMRLRQLRAFRRAGVHQSRPDRRGDADNVREGFVVKPVKERYSEEIGRVILKRHGEGYLLRKKK